VAEGIAQRRPARAGHRFHERFVAERADGGLVLAPSPIGVGEQFFDGGAVHASAYAEARAWRDSRTWYHPGTRRKPIAMRFQALIAAIASDRSAISFSSNCNRASS